MKYIKKITFRCIYNVQKIICTPFFFLKKRRPRVFKWRSKNRIYLHKFLEKNGINIAGCFSGEFGIGEGARSMVRAVEAGGISFVLNDIRTVTQRSHDRTFDRFSNDNPYRVNLINVNANESEKFFYKKGKRYFSDRYSIGRWSWELSSFPKKWDKAFSVFNEIWSISSFCTESFSQRSPIPVVTIPHAIEIDTSSVCPSRQGFHLPVDAYVFLFIFDMFSVFNRKNPLAVIEVFRSVFRADENVFLVLKCMNGSCDKKNLDLLKKNLSKNIILLDNCMDHNTVYSVIESSDCYISLHRSEGFGLTLAEAMYLKKPVIATGYSGNMDFMNSNNSFLVKHKLIELKENYGPYERGGVWAEPDIDHAARLMRYVYENREVAKSIGECAGSDIRRTLSPVVVGEKIKNRLSEIGLM